MEVPYAGKWQKESAKLRGIALACQLGYAMPAELQATLDASPRLGAAFDALTPGRRKSHMLHVAGAKQPQTRATRAERCARIILEGRGFNERAKS
jgi:uncharacterized protein YdeI (YjbR/CyaY-like superfamily)